MALPLSLLTRSYLLPLGHRDRRAGAGLGWAGRLEPPQPPVTPLALSLPFHSCPFLLCLVTSSASRLQLLARPKMTPALQVCAHPRPGGERATSPGRRGVHTVLLPLDVGSCLGIPQARSSVPPASLSHLPNASSTRQLDTGSHRRRPLGPQRPRHSSPWHSQRGAGTSVSPPAPSQQLPSPLAWAQQPSWEKHPPHHQRAR